MPGCCQRPLEVLWNNSYFRVIFLTSLILEMYCWYSEGWRLCNSSCWWCPLKPEGGLSATVVIFRDSVLGAPFLRLGGTDGPARGHQHSGSPPPPGEIRLSNSAAVFNQWMKTFFVSFCCSSVIPCPLPNVLVADSILALVLIVQVVCWLVLMAFRMRFYYACFNLSAVL